MSRDGTLESSGLNKKGWNMKSFNILDKVGLVRGLALAMIGGPLMMLVSVSIAEDEAGTSAHRFGGANALVVSVGEQRAAKETHRMQPPFEHLKVTWYYSAKLFERVDNPGSTWHPAGERSGSVSATTGGEASAAAEKKIRDDWDEDHKAGGVKLRVDFDWLSTEPKTDQPDQEDPNRARPTTPKAPLADLPFVTTLSTSGEQVKIERVIGSDHSCVVAYLPLRSQITEVRVRAHDKLDSKQDAALWVYVDGKPVKNADKQNVAKDGSVLTWKFEPPVVGAMISLVAREQNWTPSKGGKTETAHVYWISADFEKQRNAKISSVISHESPGIIVPSPDNAQSLHTFACDVKEASTILVFADDYLGQSQRAHIQLSVNGTVLGREPVYLAGGWICFEVNGAKGSLIEVQSFHENGKANGDDLRLHHIAVLR